MQYYYYLFYFFLSLSVMFFLSIFSFSNWPFFFVSLFFFFFSIHILNFKVSWLSNYLAIFFVKGFWFLGTKIMCPLVQKKRKEKRFPNKDYPFLSLFLFCVCFPLLIIKCFHFLHCFCVSFLLS